MSYEDIKEHNGFIVGEKIICILNNRASLTVGKEYILLHLDVNYSNDDFYICIKNDKDYEEFYHNSRFINKNNFRTHLINDILK